MVELKRVNCSPQHEQNPLRADNRILTIAERMRNLMHKEIKKKDSDAIEAFIMPAVVQPNFVANIDDVKDTRAQNPGFSFSGTSIKSKEAVESNYNVPGVTATITSEKSVSGLLLRNRAITDPPSGVDKKNELPHDKLSLVNIIKSPDTKDAGTIPMVGSGLNEYGVSPWVMVQNNLNASPESTSGRTKTLLSDPRASVEAPHPDKMSSASGSEMLWSFKSWGNGDKHSAKLVFSGPASTIEKVNIIPSDEAVRRALITQHDNVFLSNVIISHVRDSKHGTHEHSQKRHQQDGGDDE